VSSNKQARKNEFSQVAESSRQMESIKTPKNVRDREIQQRSQDERRARLSSIENPIDMTKLIADLKWLIEKGIYEDIDVLFRNRYNPSFNLEALGLVSHAIKCISDRDMEERSRNRPAEILQITTLLDDESKDDRTQRFNRVRIYAIEVLGSEASADNWLNTPRPELDQKTAIDFLVTPKGAEIVELMLGRIEYGVYS
jgi:putative toxin-antitoxin system antitoxin component (TIGR02293 family)